jgi:hypothetical protein
MGNTVSHGPFSSGSRLWAQGSQKGRGICREP